MLTFNGLPFLGQHRFVRADAPKPHVQRTQFAGIWGESQIWLGQGGRDLSIECWLTDPSFVSSAAVDQYRQLLDSEVGQVGGLAVSGNTVAYYQDCCFEGFEAASSVLPAIGAGFPAGTFWQEGVLHFHQLTTP